MASSYYESKPQSRQTAFFVFVFVCFLSFSLFLLIPKAPVVIAGNKVDLRPSQSVKDLQKQMVPLMDQFKVGEGGSNYDKYTTDRFSVLKFVLNALL